MCAVIEHGEKRSEKRRSNSTTTVVRRVVRGRTRRKPLLAQRKHGEGGSVRTIIEEAEVVEGADDRRRKRDRGGGRGRRRRVRSESPLPFSLEKAFVHHRREGRRTEDFPGGGEWATELSLSSLLSPLLASVRKGGRKGGTPVSVVVRREQEESTLYVDVTRKGGCRRRRIGIFLLASSSNNPTPFLRHQLRAPDRAKTQKRLLLNPVPIPNPRAKQACRKKT